MQEFWQVAIPPKRVSVTQMHELNDEENFVEILTVNLDEAAEETKNLWRRCREVYRALDDNSDYGIVMGPNEALRVLAYCKSSMGASLPDCDLQVACVGGILPFKGERWLRFVDKEAF